MEYPELQQHVDDLKDDIVRLRTDLVDVVRTMMEAGKAEAGEVREKLEAKARAQLDMLVETMAATRQRGQAAADMMCQKIERNPMTSVMIAGGIGFLLGIVLRRR